jgi:histone acetyltransferase MYST1
VSVPSSPEREHAVVTRVRNFEDVRFGEYLIKTWYYSPYPTLEERSDERAASPTPLSRGNSHKRRKLNGSEIVAEQPGDTSNDRARYKGNPHGNGSGKAPSSKLKASQEIFNGTATKVVEPTRGRIWVCDVSPSHLDGQSANDLALFQIYEE